MSASTPSSPPSSRSSLSFCGLRIEYDDRVLTPRTWTELQSRWAAELAADAQGPLLELCCGAGHIGLGAASLAGRDLVAVDLDPTACDLARRNARAAQDAGLATVVEVRQGPVGAVLRDGEVFAVAMADPPWVTSDGVGRFPEDPLLAIDGGADGLGVARECVSAVRGHLRRGGSLLVQVGTDDQADRVAAEAAASGWREGDRRRAPASGSSSGGVLVALLHP